MPNTYSLLCYTREATGREEANNEDIAYSMHLALRLGDDDGARWRPLNNQMGSLMAATCMAILPTLLLFLFAQKYFLQSLNITSGLKG